MSSQRKTAIVTGASQGIGAGLVRAFVERGFNVVANSRKVTQSTEVTASDHVALVDGHVGEPATATKIVETPHQRARAQRPHQRAPQAQTFREALRGLAARQAAQAKRHPQGQDAGAEQVVAVTPASARIGARVPRRVACPAHSLIDPRGEAFSMTRQTKAHSRSQAPRAEEDLWQDPGKLHPRRWRNAYSASRR